MLLRKIVLTKLLLTLFMGLTSLVPVHAGTPVEFDANFQDSTIGPGSTTLLTFTIQNNSNAPVQGLNFSATMPAGVTLQTPANPQTSCLNGTVIAADGGTMINFSGGDLGAFQTCTVTVLVTSSTPGTHTLTTSDLTFVGGLTPFATDDLTVDAGRFGFTKSFSPSTIAFDGTSTLTFTIDGSMIGGNTFNISFADMLPLGLVVADVPNATISCVGSVNANPGDTSISLFSGFTTANQSCVVTVDVKATVPNATLVNTTSTLSSTRGSSGFAAATISTGPRPAFFKRFLNDPVVPGGIAQLEFEMINLDRNFTASNITFTDNLDAMLMGAVAVGLPQNNVVGIGSQLSGTSLITLTGGTLAPGERATFVVDVQIPAGATPGTYTNTTSSVTSSLGTLSPPASDDLIVENVPQISLVFTDPVGSGGVASGEYTIVNTSSTQTLNNIAFTMQLEDPLGLLGAPGVGPACNGTLSIVNNSGTLFHTFFGGSLAPGAMCTIPFTLPLAANQGGDFNFITSRVTGDLGGVPVIGNQASDTLTVIGPPRISKRFVTNPVSPGGMVELEFTLSHDATAPADATNITFTDDLNAFIAGAASTSGTLNNICGTGSSISGTNLLTFTGGTLAPGASCTFSVMVQIPAAALPGNFRNTSSNVTATVSGEPVTGASASADLLIGGLTFTKSFTDDPVSPGGQATLEFTITNDTTATATGMFFTDTLSVTLPGLVSSSGTLTDPCGTGSSLSGTSFLIFTGGELAPMSSCTFSVTVDVPAGAAPGSYGNTTSFLTATIGGSVVAIPAATDILEVRAPLAMTKTFVQDTVFPGDTIDMTIELTNLDPTTPITNITFTDNLDAALPGLIATTVPALNFCGAGSEVLGSGTGMLTFQSITVPAGGTCSIPITLTVPAGAPAGTLANNITSGATGDLGGVTVSAPPASDSFAIGILSFEKSFSGTTFPGGTVDLTFTITNGSMTDTVTDLEFMDDLTTLFPGATVSGPFPTDPVGAGSTLSGTSTISLANGTLGPGATAMFTVTVAVPAAVAPGMYVNTTGQLRGLVGASPVNAPAATAMLTVIPAADLSVSVVDSPDPVIAGNNLTYTVTVTNNGPNPADGVVLTSMLPGILTGTTSSGCLEDPAGTATCTIGTIAPSSSVMITFMGTVPSTAAAGTISGTFTVSTTTLDPNAANNSVTEDTTVNVDADVQIAVTDSPDPVIAGNNLTYNVTVTNNGPSTAPSTVLSTILPANVTLVSTTGCVEDPNGVMTCTLGDLAPGAMAMVTIVVAVDPTTSGPVDTTFSANSTAPDSIPANNTTMESTTVNREADLAITVSDAPDPVIAGNNFAYTLTVTNNGPSSATNVDIVSMIPGSAVPLSSVGCIQDPNGVTVCSLATIAPGASVMLTYNMGSQSDAQGTIDSTFTVSGNETDPTPANDTAMESTTLDRQSDLVTTITGPMTTGPGGVVNYTVTVVNNGPSTTNVVNVNVPFPASLTNVTWTCASTLTAVCAGAGTGDIIDSVFLFAGSMVTYTVNATVGAAFVGNIDITAMATTSDGATDPSPADATDMITTVSSSEANVSGTMTVMVQPGPIAPKDLPAAEKMPIFAMEGDTLIYTVMLTNAGPGAQLDDPANDEYSNVLPAVLSLQSGMVIAGGGTILVDTGTNTVTWNGTIPAMGVITLQYQATINMGASPVVISNQGTIFYDGDGDGTNDTMVPTDDPTTPVGLDPTTVIASSTVPTLGAWGLIILITLLMAYAVYTRRRTASV